MNMKKIVFAIIMSFSLILSGCSLIKMSNSQVLSEIKTDVENLKTGYAKISIDSNISSDISIGISLEGDFSNDNKFAHMNGTFDYLGQIIKIEEYVKDKDIYVKTYNRWSKTTTDQAMAQLDLNNITDFKNNNGISKLLEDEKYWDFSNDDTKYTITLKKDDATKEALKKYLIDTTNSLVKNNKLNNDTISYIDYNIVYELNKKTKDLSFNKNSITVKIKEGSSTIAITTKSELSDINKEVKTDIPSDVINNAK